MAMQITWILSLVLHIFCIAEGQHDTNCAPGRQVIVHLFEWRWADIAAECERFLGPRGYCGVQISPPNEHRVIPEYNPNNVFNRYSPVTRPWYQRYQPVSYKLTSRSGTEDELIDMIRRCNDVNVRIYADAVINHMTGDRAYGSGSAGSAWNSANLSFPDVPYSEHDFHSDCGVSNYNDAYQVRNCRLLALLDLDVGTEYVRSKIAGYLNKLISLGVAGFRVDAAKHMHPSDLMAIRDKLNTLNTTYFAANSTAFIFQEVIDMGGEAISAHEYLDIGRVTEFKYGKELARLFRQEVQLKYSVNFGEGWGMIETNMAVVFVDNHDNQRGHVAGGNIITFRDPRLYKMANAFMLAWPYGLARLMSSYNWDTYYENGQDKNSWVGPPASGNSVRNTDSVPIANDDTCGDDWICEHRWRQIANMVAFRNTVTGQGVDNWWDNWKNQIAFGRGGKGFIAINGDTFPMYAELSTGMPPGTYCDVISGDTLGNRCSGRVLRVGHDGQALLDIPDWLEDPMLAVHEGSRISSSPRYGLTDLAIYRRTAVIIEKLTSPGEDLFIRGGFDHSRRPSCKQIPDDCKIPINYRPMGAADHYDKYNAWASGDTTLDWGGSERGQGSYNGTVASGSPMVWTTSNPKSAAYHNANSYGDHFWVIDIDMDCSKTENGWFELKAVIATANGVHWETDISYGFNNPTLAGSTGARLPFCSKNHFAMCGKINVLKFGIADMAVHNF